MDTQVGLGQLLLGLLPLLGQSPELGGVGEIPPLLQLLPGQIAGAHLLGQHDLLLRGQERHLADLLEVHAHRIVDGEAVHQGVGVNQLLLLDALDLAERRLHVVGDLRQDVLLTADLNGQGLQGVVELLHLVAVQLDLVQDLHHLRGVQAAPLLPPGEQVHHLFVGHQNGGTGQIGHHLLRELGIFLIGLPLLSLGGGAGNAFGHLILLFCHVCFPP